MCTNIAQKHLNDGGGGVIIYNHIKYDVTILPCKGEQQLLLFAFAWCIVKHVRGDYNISPFPCQDYVGRPGGSHIGHACVNTRRASSVFLTPLIFVCTFWFSRSNTTVSIGGLIATIIEFTQQSVSPRIMNCSHLKRSWSKLIEKKRYHSPINHYI